MAEKYPFFYGALGIHPNETKDLTEEDMDWLRKASGSEKIVAIGEIGLDYYWDEPDREIQKKWFVRQLSIAKDTGLPVVIHSRDAAKDTMDIIKAEHKGTHRRRDPLLFLRCEPGPGISGHGIFLRDRRRPDL